MSISASIISRTAALLLSSAALVAQDECTGAIPVFNGPNGPFSNVGMTTSFAWPCAAGGNDIWFAYIATGTGSLTLQTCGANYDSAIEIFDGTGGCGGLVSLGCNDDSCGLQSELTVGVSSGTTYFIRVGGFASSVGNFPLDLTFMLSGEECTNAETIVDGANGPYTNVGYSTSAPAWPCGAGGNDRWFAYTASCNGSATVDLCGSGYDTTLEAFCGFCGLLTSLGCNDDSCGLQSSLSFGVSMGTTYYIRVGGFAGSTGNFGINVACAPSAVVNDECGAPIAVIDGANGPFTNIGSSTSLGWTCGAGGNDVWFTYVASCCGNLTADTCGSGFDTVIEVMSNNCGCNAAATILGCNDDSCGLQSSVTVPVVTGVTYLIRVGGFAGSTGNFGLNLSCVNAPPANDDCANAVPVVLGTNGPFTNNCSTTSFAWPCAAGGNDVWYLFVANCTCPTTFQTCGADYDTCIEVFDGSLGCGSLVSLGCNDDNFTGGPCLFTLQSWLTVPLTNGGIYYVRVGGFASNVGNFPLTISTGTGLGSINMTTPTTCGVPGLALSVTGDPSIGGTINASLSGFTGLPFVTWGFAPAPLLSPACPCLILSISTSWQFAPGISLTVPCDAAFIGLPIEAQGADLFGAPACGFPVPNAFTDVWTATIG